MEIIIYALISFILLASAIKLSLWGWAPRVLWAAIVAAFVLWSKQWAVVQSKTQIADLLHSPEALQNMAVIVTLDCAAFIAFAFWRFQDPSSNAVRPRRWHRLLDAYPGLLILPVVFFLFTQSLFTFVGTDFTTTAVLFAAGTLVALPLLAEGARRLLPDADSRTELLLLLTCFICVLGLIATQSQRMVYKVQESPIDWRTILASLGGFVLLFACGMGIRRILKYKV